MDDRLGHGGRFGGDPILLEHGKEETADYHGEEGDCDVVCRVDGELFGVYYWRGGCGVGGEYEYAG